MSWVGYLFYWDDFTEYPRFTDADSIPEIRLPVRTERSSMEAILTSFIEDISDYYAWICNEIHEECMTDESCAEVILREYLRSR